MSANLLRTQVNSDETMQIDTNEKKAEENQTKISSQIKIVAYEGNYIQDNLVMMEFQGEFEHSEVSQFDSLDLGLIKEVSTGNYELQIGNHLLRGKIIDLPKPIIMTEKVKNELGETELIVKGVIKQKINFSGRPTPLRKDPLQQDNTKRRLMNN